MTNTEPVYRLYLDDLGKLNFSGELLATLALRTLGVSPAELVDIFDLADTNQFDQLMDRTLSGVKDNEVPDTVHIPGYDPKLVGKEHLKALLNTQGLPYTRTNVNTQFERFLEPYPMFDVSNKKTYWDVDTGCERFRQIDPHATADTISAIIEQYSEPDNLELLLLCPYPTTKRTDKCWDVLTFDAKAIDEDSALRIVFALILLGFGQLQNKEHTNALASLVRNSRDLSEHIFVCKKEKRAEQITDPRWKWHQVFNRNQLLLNKKEPIASTPYPILLNLTDVKSQKQFGSWKPVIRPALADKLSQGLTELMLNTSGILCRIQLRLNSAAKTNHKSDFRVYAPKPWIKHFKQVKSGSSLDDAVKAGKNAKYYLIGSTTYQDFKAKRKPQKAHPNIVRL